MTPLPDGCNLNIIGFPAVEPITVQDVKDQSRIEVDDDDAYILSRIPAARIECEAIAGRAFIATQYELILPQFPCVGSFFGPWFGPIGDRSFCLPRPPLLSVDSFQYRGPSGAMVDLDPTSYVFAKGTPGRIAPALGRMWPLIPTQLGSVRIAYTAGYGPDAAHVPANVRAAIAMLAAFYYSHRDEDAPTPDYIARVLGNSTYLGYA